MSAPEQLVSVSAFDTCIGLRHVSFTAGVEHFCRDYAEAWGIPTMTAVITRQRVLAAQRAADRLPSGSTPGLEAVYREIRLLPGWPTDAATMQAAEARFHLEEAVCNERARAYLEGLRNRASAILFLVTTPLPSPAIRELFMRFDLLGARDEIHVAHELGVDFKSREGFRRFLRSRPTPVSRWTHYGNGNPAERRAVEAAGGSYQVFFDTTPNRYETPDPKRGLENSPMASSIMAIQRNVRMLTTDRQPPVLNRIFANVVAPLLTSYVQEVLSDARERGIEILYFVARDGQILKTVAGQLDHGEIALRYLFGSRQAWLLPSVADHPEEAPGWMTLWGQPTSPRNVLKRAEIEPEEIRPLMEKHGLGNREDYELRGRHVTAMHALLHEPEVLRLIQRKAHHRRATMIAYLRQEGLMRESNWALVDIGWSGRCQRAINTVLKAGGYTGEVHGYYLGLNQYHVDFSESGPAIGYAVDDHSLPKRHPIRTLFRYQALVEEVFTIADHGSTRYYEDSEGAVRPHCRPFEPEPQTREILQAQHRICREFARLWSRHSSIGVPQSVLKHHALANLARFFNEPEIEEVQAIRWFRVGADQNGSGRLPLAKPYSLGDCLRILKRRVLQYHAHSHSRWREGSIAISPSSIRTCINAAAKFYALWRQQRARTSRWMAHPG